MVALMVYVLTPGVLEAVMGQGGGQFAESAIFSTVTVSALYTGWTKMTRRLSLRDLALSHP